MQLHKKRSKKRAAVTTNTRTEYSSATQLNKRTFERFSCFEVEKLKNENKRRDPN